jgi:hypothetical protein
MSGFRLSVKRLAALLVVAVLAGAATSSEAQLTRRTRRESNANRKARIAKAIEETYAHRWEVAGGGGFLRFNSGPFTQKNDEVTWATSVSYNLNPKWSAVGDIRGSYGDAKVNPLINNPVSFNGVYRPLITEYTFMAGPQYRFYAKQHLSVSGHVIAGIALGNFDGGSKGVPATTLGLWPTSNRAAFSAGVNVDYNFYPNLAFRVTPTYVGTNFGDKIQNNLGFNMGIVYRFGHTK